jgi:hypothetical protein
MLNSAKIGDWIEFFGKIFYIKNTLDRIGKRMTRIFRDLNGFYSINLKFLLNP